MRLTRPGFFMRWLQDIPNNNVSVASSRANRDLRDGPVTKRGTFRAKVGTPGDVPKVTKPGLRSYARTGFCDLNLRYDRYTPNARIDNSAENRHPPGAARHQRRALLGGGTGAGPVGPGTAPLWLRSRLCLCEARAIS